MSEQTETTEPVQPVQPTNPSVTLSVEDWKNVIASIEAGVKAIGYTAFVVGGNLIEDIARQLNEQMKQ